MNDTTKPAAALEPCPFCGASVDMNYHKPTESFYVACSECSAHTCDHGAEEAEAAAAWNRRAPKASAVPEGWKLVPMEPTPEMLSAAWNGGALGGEDDHRECYGYMLAAAPQAGVKHEQ